MAWNNMVVFTFHLQDGLACLPVATCWSPYSIFWMGWVAYLKQHGGLDGVLPHEAHLPPWRSCNQAISEDDDENNVHLQAGERWWWWWWWGWGSTCQQPSGVPKEEELKEIMKTIVGQNNRRGGQNQISHLWFWKVSPLEDWNEIYSSAPKRKLWESESGGNHNVAKPDQPSFLQNWVTCVMISTKTDQRTFEKDITTVRY